MSLSLTVTRGHTFVSGTPITTADLNAAALPSVLLSGTVGTADLVDGAVSNLKITPGAICAVTTTGSANAYLASPTPAVPALVANTWLILKSNFTNTGSATLNVSGLGAKSIKKLNGSDVQAGDIQSGQLLLVAYDGTNWQMLNDAKASVWNFAVATGAANTYAITVRESLGLADIVGLPIVFQTNAANTGACTLNVNGLGAKSIKLVSGSDPLSGDLPSGALVQVAYDGTNFKLLGNYGRETAGTAGTYAYPTSLTTDSAGRVTAVTPGSKYVTSSGAYAAIPAAGAKAEFTHGLGSTPWPRQIVLICTSAELGYSVDDEMDIGAGWESPGAGDEEVMLSAVYANATVIGIVRYSDMTNIKLPHKSTGVRTAITEANWKIKGYGYK